MTWATGVWERRGKRGGQQAGIRCGTPWHPSRGVHEWAQGSGWESLGCAVAAPNVAARGNGAG